MVTQDVGPRSDMLAGFPDIGPKIFRCTCNNISYAYLADDSDRLMSKYYLSIMEGKQSF